jgi:branched-chain amino acid transport system substrate-binding protein
MGKFRRTASSLVAGLMLAGGAITALSLAGPEAQAGASAAPIKIGLVCSCTGPLSEAVVDNPAIYKAWADSVNATGGINGHKIQVLYKDDASNPTTSNTIVHTFIETDHVVAIVDSTNNDAAWATYVQQQKVPVVGMDTSTEPYYSNSDFYPEGQTEDSLFSGIIQAVKHAGGTKFALFYCAEAVQCQQGIAPLQAAAKGAGLSVVDSLEVSASAPSYTAQCLAAKQAGATVIFTADTQGVDEKIIQDCYQQGYKPKVVIDGEILLPSLTTTPAINQATYFTVPNLPYFVNSPAITAMNKALDKYAPGVRKHATYGELPMETWIAGKMFQAAAVAGHLGANGAAPTAAAVTKGLNSFNGVTLGGLAPSLTFAAGKPHPVDCWYWALLKDGKYSTPYGLKPSCQSAS